MSRRPENEGNPHTEVVDFKDLTSHVSTPTQSSFCTSRHDTYLTPGKSQHSHTQDLCNRDSADHTACYIDHRCPSTNIAASETVPGCAFHGRTTGESERPGDVCSEFDADAHAYDEVDE